MKETPDSLGEAQIKQFTENGFVRIDSCFPRELADAGRDILWGDLPCDADDPTTWTKPLIRLGPYGDEPFRRAANSPALYAAFDQLVGKGRWYPLDRLGSFPVRFPHKESPDDDLSWHIDVGFPDEDSDPKEKTDYSSWRANISSRGCALLMLFLFSDVGEYDAPTRIKVGSHRDIARLLEPAGEAGMTNEMMREFTAKLDRPQQLATGQAGTTYLCHPFLVHTGQQHSGLVPRFMAQASLYLAEPFKIHRENGDYSVAEIAVREALR